MSRVKKSLAKNKNQKSVTQKINKPAHSLGKRTKQTSGTKDDKDTGGHQARSSSFLKMCVNFEVLLSHSENCTAPHHVCHLKISRFTALDSLHFKIFSNKQLPSYLPLSVCLFSSINSLLKWLSSEHTCKVRDVRICPMR